jgi:hypothetical protein
MHRLDFPDALPMQDEDIASFRDSVGRFLDKYATPEVIDGFRKAGIVSRDSGAGGPSGPAGSQHGRSLWRRRGRLPP